MSDIKKEAGTRHHQWHSKKQTIETDLQSTLDQKGADFKITQLSFKGRKEMIENFGENCKLLLKLKTLQLKTTVSLINILKDGF